MLPRRYLGNIGREVEEEEGVATLFVGWKLLPRLRERLSCRGAFADLASAGFATTNCVFFFFWVAGVFCLEMLLLLPPRRIHSSHFLSFGEGRGTFLLIFPAICRNLG